MDLDIDPSWAIAVYLLSIRIGALFVATPIFAHLRGGGAIRVLFTLALAAVFASGLNLHALHLPHETAGLVSASLSEAVLGAVLAFGVFAAFGAFSIAGKILDVQSGFGIANVFDPVTGANSPLFSSMLNLLAVTVFFSMDAHHALMRGIEFSVTQVPPGVGLSAIPFDAALRQFGLMFSLGLSLVAPVMFCLLLVDTGFAVVSRILPQMNVFVVSIPVKIVVALAVFAMTMPVFGPTMGRVYASIFDYWEQVLR